MKTACLAAVIIGLLLAAVYIENAKCDALEKKVESLLKSTEIQNAQKDSPRVIVQTKKKN